MPSLQLKQWDMLANGFAVKFTPQTIDGSGNLKGKIVDGTKTHSVEGFWDEDARKITFMRIIDPAKPSTIQFFTGYLADTSHLAGTFEAFAGSGATAKRFVFGWSAQLPKSV